LCDYKTVDKMLTPFIEEHTEIVGEELALCAKENLDEVIEASIDYHDISFSNSTFLLYFSRNNIKDLVNGIMGIIKHKPPNPCPDYISVHLENTRLDVLNIWMTFGLLNRTSGSLATKGYFYTMSAGQTKLWLFGLLLWVVFTLDIMPAFLSWVCFISLSQRAWDVYDLVDGPSRHYQYFLLILPKAFFLAFMFPMLVLVMTNGCAESRFFFGLGGAAIWIVMLMWTTDYNTIISYPFQWRTDFNYNAGSGVQTRQPIIDSIVLVSLAVSFTASVMQGWVKTVFTGSLESCKYHMAIGRGFFIQQHFTIG